MKKLFALVLAMCLILTGCANISNTAHNDPSQIKITPTKNELKTVNSYKDVFKALTERTSNNMTTGTWTTDAPMEAPADMEVAVEEDAAVDIAETTNGAVNKGNYSETNVQTEGVDEGDIVKTDGKYIYYFDGTELRIVEANGADSEIISKLVLNEDADMENKYYNDIYLCGEYLAAVGNKYDNESYESTALISVYDISDPTNVKLADEFTQTGYINSTRLVGDVIYVITNYYVGSPDEDEPITYIPRYCVNGAETLVATDDICIPEESNSAEWLSVSAYDVAKHEVISTKSMLGGADTVYMSGNNIYVADAEWKNESTAEYTKDQYKVTDYSDYSKTNIHKFSYSDGNIEYSATGVVVGNLLNQFSMDEYDGKLRVVTTDNSYSYRIYKDDKYGFENYEDVDNDQTNGLYVLDENLEVMGSVDKLAEDERVYSVRFSGETCYFVTFRETDPLFAADLSDPANPTILSALKINGFSQYLHSWGEGKLVGIGMEADDEGRVSSMKLSMFDVSDPKNVSEYDKLILPYNYSESLYNHHAVFADVERGLLGFGTDDGYALYSVGDGGFTEFAVIDDIVADYNIRGVRIGDNLYIVGVENITILDLVNGGAVLATLEYDARG